jgi:hypothetical protein
MIRPPSEPLEFSITSLRKGRSGTRLTMVVLATSVIASALTAMFISSAGNEALVPLTTCIPIFAFVWMVMQTRPVQGKLRWVQPTLSLHEGRRRWQATVTQTDLVPWVMAGVGTVQGSVLVLHTVNDAGIKRVLQIAAAEIAPPPGSGQSTPAEPDMWTDPSNLRNLIAAVGVTEKFEASPPPEGEHRFALVRRPTARDALSQIAPWFGTMAFLGVAGALFGETVSKSETGLAVFGVFCAVVIGYGIRRTIKKAGAAKPTFTFVIRPQSLQVVDAQKNVIWGFTGPVHVNRSNYLYRTKYSSHRFSVLCFGTSDNALRIGVWDPRYTNTAHPDGPAPNYIVGAPDWIALQTAVQSTLRA